MTLGGTAGIAHADGRLDIVIPYREETPELMGCLDAILDGACELDLRVILVRNRAVSPGGEAALQSIRARFEAAGIDLVALREPRPGKIHALNTGDAARRDCSVLYLDDDVVLIGDALGDLARGLAATAAPLLASPRPRIEAGHSWLTRQFAALWCELPAVSGDVVGAGCYAVNAAGRARWQAFPEVVGDDAYVRSRFRREERVQTPGEFLIRLGPPLATALALARWRAGNRQLRSLPSIDGIAPSDPGLSTYRNGVSVLRRPRLWASLPGFLLISVAARLAGVWRPILGIAWPTH